jgi:hypothetical protein
MDNESAKQSSNPVNASDHPDSDQKSTHDPNVVDVRELVYNDGTDRNPHELLTDPGVAPQMLDDRRDLRTDLLRESDDSATTDS